MVYANVPVDIPDTPAASAMVTHAGIPAGGRVVVRIIAEEVTKVTAVDIRADPWEESKLQPDALSVAIGV
jgi:hypothetical protein